MISNIQEKFKSDKMDLISKTLTICNHKILRYSSIKREIIRVLSAK